MSATLLRETARLLIQHTLDLPEKVARHHVSLLGEQTAAFADGAFTSATLTLTKAGAFTVALCHVGTVIYLSDNGSGEVNPGYYTVRTHPSVNAVTLDRDLRSGVPAPTDVVCFLGRLASMAGISIDRQGHWKERVLHQLPPLREPVWPAVADVAQGTVYGPDGDNYTGTLV